MAAYTASWATENTARAEALMSNRCVASTPVTPRELRWNTAAR